MEVVAEGVETEGDAAACASGLPRDAGYPVLCGRWG